MKKFVIMGLLAGLLSAWLPPVPGKAAEPETGEEIFYCTDTKKPLDAGEETSNATISKVPQDSDFEIDADGVLVKYHGTEEVVTVPDGVTRIGEMPFGEIHPFKRYFFRIP